MAILKAHSFKIKNGQNVTVRSAEINDAKQILNLANEVIGEEIFQLTSSSEFKMTIDDEIKWIESHLNKPVSIILVATIENNIVGILNFASGHRNRIAHTGEFGMSVYKAFRNHGIGKLLLQVLTEWALSTGKIEKINLQVHGTNSAAIEAYKKSGFVIEGVKKREIKYSDSEYVDSVLMAKFIGNRVEL